MLSSPSPPFCSEFLGNTSDSGVSELPKNENNHINIGEGMKGFLTKQGGKGRKKGGRGSKNKKWSKEERCVLWECYVRSGGDKVKGYRDSVMEMWNGRDLNVRTRASVLAQVKEIQKGGKLSIFEMREIEEKVNQERGENCDDNVDFNVLSGNVHNTNHDDMENVEGLPNISIIVERLDCIRKDGCVKLLSDEEKVTLDRIRMIYNSEERTSIPTLKGKDNWLVMREVSLVNRLLSNISPFCKDVSSLNKLLYAGSYVVCERLNLMNKKKGAKQNFLKP